MGGSKLIETPEKMWELFEEYQTKTKKNPILQHDFVGKEAESVRREKEKPLIMEGFENYVANLGLNQSLDHYFGNLDARYNDYVSICSRIRRCIREDQISGGMAGIYNASITQRLNNLVEKTDTTIREQPLFPDDVV